MKASPPERRRWYHPLDETQSASELVERGIAVVFAVLRGGLTIQIALTLPFLLSSPAPQWGLAVLAVLAVGHSATLVVAMLRAHRMSTRWGVVDLVVGVGSLLACTALIPDSVSSWINWAPALLNQVAAFVPAWCRRPRHSIPIGVALGALYLTVFLAHGTADTLSVIENAISLPMFTIAAAAFAAYCRRVARQSDETRQQAIRLATQLELAEYRFHVHNATGLLAVLARPDTPPALLPSLRRQAGEESNRLRNQLLRAHRSDPSPEDDDASVRLGTVIWEATAGFGHLPLELPIALGRNALMSQKQALAVQAALIALLYNVQFHAQASEVTIHADLTGDIWEVTVTDDGVGFDPDNARLGFGLRVQVIDSLERNDIAVRLESRKGEGTCVTMTGRSAAG